MLQLTVYTAPECCLCDEARQAIDRVVERHGVRIEVDWVDITTDPALEQAHRVEIPVGYADGRKLFKYRVDEEMLARRARAAAAVAQS